MSRRHYLARLESLRGEEAVYAFTPDSVTGLHWGRVAFSLTDFSYRILEPAADSRPDVAAQSAACVALAFKLSRGRTADPSRVPDVLEFVA